MEPNCKPLTDVLDDLQKVAGDAPFLALGQTVFWDEPMKAGVSLMAKRLGKPRRLIAGVHDTDYFAKLPSGSRGNNGRFKALPHNDTTTRGLWSAAGEFSALFGSETVITREMLLAAGLRLSRLQQARPNILDEATEAWGWRGIVALGDHAPVTAEVPLKQLLPELMSTFDWATQVSLDMLAGEGRQMAEKLMDELRGEICDLSDGQATTLSEFYQRLLPIFYDFCANAHVDLETTRTTELLRFNPSTAGLPRFEMFGLFVDPNTREMANAAYDEAIQGSSGLYEVSRFGTGAIPFDLVIPGLGRGTIRLGKKAAVINTPVPQFLTYRKPLTCLRDLAELIEAKFGSNCVVVGKAVALIGMLARDHVFVFHEGASSYVKHSRRLHEILAAKGHPLPMNPILRIRYDTWAALRVCCSWLRLPEPLQRPFGTEEVCAPSLSNRWRDVADEQRGILSELGKLRRPIELIRFLDQRLGGSWRCLAEEYEGLHSRLQALQEDLAKLKEQRRALYTELRELRKLRVEAEMAKGRHWRERIFEKEPAPGDLAERERLTQEVEKVLHARTDADRRVHELRREQQALVSHPEVQRVHERRQSIELEAELKRLRIIRQAVTASRGMEQANRRPSAWWFRIVCPDGLWFRETVETAEYYLEPLS
ncbi:hypothetical protein [Fimbriimonas ginsengisoli]|uniref:Uncharacterized protein n=1 Tax=Fimbriimonas ginsengisoli Gsoil 348 TaxID=661478 RepID=A0A068NLC6_FIMGI|nr:hypothetical protein [Fimbriimonas ginsengisoli]AIE84222.1 hypothetical protein OP10G_0854 [Fimbriimonas ginsengisoli Gsoil 348]